MTEFENSPQAPLSPQEDERDMESFRLFTEPANRTDPQLTHCRVPLSAWFGETMTFCKRYFWRLLLLSAVISVLSYLGYSRTQQCWTKTEGSSDVTLDLVAGTGTAFADEETADFFAETDETAAESKPGGKGEEPADSSNSNDSNSESVETQNQASDSETSPDKAAGTAAKEIEYSFSDSIGLKQNWSIFKLIAFIFQMMVMCWGIRTIQQDDGSWRNLLFPSWTTVFKLIAVSAIMLLLVGAAIFIAVGPLDGFFAKLGGVKTQIAVLLFALLFLFAKFALSGQLIVDRDFGPFRAMNTSWTFMRSNVSALILGIILTGLAFAILAVLFAVPLGCLLYSHFDQANASPEAVQQQISSLTSLRCGVGAYTIIIGTLTNLWTTGLFSVFYLMATGQKRPGAWPRDPASADEPQE